MAGAVLLATGTSLDDALPQGEAVRASVRESGIGADVAMEVPPPTGAGKDAARPAGGTGSSVASPPGTGPDVFLADGAENALAVDVGDPDLLVAVLNQGFSVTPSMLTSGNGNATWTVRTFPNGSGSYTGSPFDPWASPGNTPGQLFVSLIRRDVASPNARTVVARSMDGGLTWPLFFERALDVFQDRAIFDVDRTTSLGGGAGEAHDGKVYLCFDNWGVGFSGYVDSRLQVISPGGEALTELLVSTAANFRGTQVQPVAGINDGQVHLMSLGGAGTVRILRFHEVTGAGTNALFNKSSLTFFKTGQELRDSNRWGLNGHRINGQMQMDIDRTSGPRRGWLYVVSDRNPSPSDPALDQGDVYVSVSTDGGSSWSSSLVPGQAPGRTQFLTMIDVDDNGWIHVAYYQNETGSADDGVLNASSANVYYTLSLDGGATWAPQVQVNDPLSSLDYFDPPPDLSGQSYYLIGDFCQVRAAGAGSSTRLYAFWTGYDKDRSDLFTGDKRERVLCTTIMNLVCLGDLDADLTVGIADLVALLAAWGAAPSGPPDLDNDGAVGIGDLRILLDGWGPCQTPLRTTRDGGAGSRATSSGQRARR
jgi:hypothetical protein